MANEATAPKNSVPKNMATIYIDDKPFEVEAGENVLQVVLGLGLDLPYFCWHPAMGSVGACRQCALVQFRDEEDTRGRIVMGCMTPATDGARFSMQGPDATEFRKNIVESLMLNHPHDCPVCAEGGECHLQDMTMMVGHRDRSYRGRKNTHNNQDLGPLIHHEMNRCISCYRCTRYYNDYAGGKDLAAQAAHDHVYFGRHEDGTLESEFAGNLVEVCPTGVFTDKPLVNEYTRKWDMQSAPSVCTGCALGCNISPGERYGKLKRIHNRYNSAVNGYFLCDRGRYGGNFVNDEKRAEFAGVLNANGRYNAIHTEQALKQLSQWCNHKKVIGIGSPRASLETNYLLQRIAGEQNFCSGMADHEVGLVAAIKDRLQHGSVNTPSMQQVESADVVLVLGEDVTNTAPRLALALRQSVRNLGNELAAEARIPLWQDEAVRNLAQDQLSPLFVVAMGDTPLDDVAEQSVALSPKDIASLAHAISAKIDTSLPAVDVAHDALAQRIADALKNAKRPLIVSGTGAQSIEIIHAASEIAEALNNSNAMLSYCLPEANTMGLAMITENTISDTLSIADICAQADKGQINTLIIAENDLYRRAPRKYIDKLLRDVDKLVVLDCVTTPTLAQAHLALPAASFIESQGTLVSSEGRAQRHYPVFKPAEQRQASWRWLAPLIDDEEFENFDTVTAACAGEYPELSKIEQASPAAEFRDRGMKIPRQTHRYSGRTAMLADESVHEPKQPVDEDTPFSYSMEGANSGKSGALIPFVWSPGWNSNQSIHKFQSEAGGALAGGTPGVRLIKANSTLLSTRVDAVDNATGSDQELELLPMYKIFGSEELSAQSPAIKKLTLKPTLQINPKDVERLGLDPSGAVLAQIDQRELYLDLAINSSVPLGCAGYLTGVPGADWLAPNSRTRVQKTTAKIKVENGGGNV